MIHPATYSDSFKLDLINCLVGFALALQFIHGRQWGSIKNTLVGGLEPTEENDFSTRNVFLTPDAFVMVTFHGVLADLGEIVSKKKGSVDRPLAKQSDVIKLVVKSFLPFTLPWTDPKTFNQSFFDKEIYPKFKFVMTPKTKVESSVPAGGGASPNNSKRPSNGEFYEARQEAKKVKKDKKAAEEAKAALSTASSKSGASVMPVGGAWTGTGSPVLAMSNLSLNAAPAAAPAASSVGGGSFFVKRLCGNFACEAVGVMNGNAAVVCSKGAAACQFRHPAHIGAIEKTDAIDVLTRMLSVKPPPPPHVTNYLKAAKAIWEAK